MASTLQYRLDDKQNLVVRAETIIACETDKTYRLNLTLSKQREKNPILMKDVILENGRGETEVSFDYRLYNLKGVTLTVNAHVCILPDPPEPASAGKGQDDVLKSPAPIIVDNRTEELHLFGLTECLESIRLEHTQSCCRLESAKSPAPQARILVQVKLKEEFTLLRFYEDSVDLTCLTKDGPKSPDYQMLMSANRMEFHMDALTGSMASGFSAVMWKGTGIVYHHRTGLMLALSFSFDSRSC